MKISMWNDARKLKALLVVVLILVALIGILAYQVSSLCGTVSNLSNDSRAIVTGVANVTSTLRAQMVNDKALIDELDISRPPGYQNMTSILREQIGSDNSTILLLWQLIPISNGYPSSSGLPFCS